MVRIRCSIILTLPLPRQGDAAALVPIVEPRQTTAMLRLWSRVRRLSGAMRCVGDGWAALCGPTIAKLATFLRASSDPAIEEFG